MRDYKIGDWVLREPRTGFYGTLAHLVESLIEDRAVMRCGRQMRHGRPGGVDRPDVLVKAPGRFLRCDQCKRIPS